MSTRNVALRSVTVDLVEVDRAGYVDRGSGVAEADGDVDPVQLGVGRAERGPAEVGVLAEPLACVLGFGQQLVGGVAVLVLGGGDRSAQQQRAVHRQGLGVVGADLMVEARGEGAGGGGGGSEVAAVHHGVGDDAGAGGDRDGVFAGAGGLHAAVGGQPAQALVPGLEQDARRDVVRLGGQRACLEAGRIFEDGAGGLQAGRAARVARLVTSEYRHAW